MTLEFEKVVPQVERMGRALEHRHITLSQRAHLAWERFGEKLGDLEAVRARIDLVRKRDAGYRGAAPPNAESGIHEPITRAYPLPPLPQQATLLAADGSQIYPDLHGPALYYLINIGVFVYHHGQDALPEEIVEPQLHYEDSALRDEHKHGQLVTNATVNARRTIQELHILRREAWARRDYPHPLIALTDGPLLWWANKDITNGRELEKQHWAHLGHFYDLYENMRRDRHKQFAALVGYVDRPSSTFLVSLVHLMSLAEEAVQTPYLRTNGEFEGVEDSALMLRLLGPGERSAILVQQSPTNKAYHERNPRLEIAFFYLHVGTAERFHLARVEIPMWVAQDRQAVDTVHALLYAQCEIMWRYPYALTRADELAVVRSHEKQHLAQMIALRLRENAQVVEHSQKQASKSVRHGRKAYRPPHR